MIKDNPKANAIIRATIIDNPYVKSVPADRQELALASEADELFFGGAVGGGKSEYLLMCALQWVILPGYSALIVRRTFPDLNKPGALIPRSKEWLKSTDARWNSIDKQWIFPSGSTLTFGHLEHEDDKYKYQGAEYQFIGFDEVTHFTESQYKYLFSRLRKLLTSEVIPLRIRSTGNPDGKGFEWVKRRFVNPGDSSRPFIKSKLEDNPYLDTTEYEKALSVLDPVTRAKLREGNWDVVREGNFFKASQLQIIDDLPDLSYTDVVRRWDLAATSEPVGDSSDDPDYTVGVKLCIISGVCYILDVVRGRWSPEGVETSIKDTAFMDDIETRIVMEEEPGSSGKMNTNHFFKVLQGYSFEAKRSTGPKDVRARPFASWVNAGRVKLLAGSWNDAFIEELSLFPKGSHDDMVDAASAGFLDISNCAGDTSFYSNEGISVLQDKEFMI